MKRMLWGLALAFVTSAFVSGAGFDNFGGDAQCGTPNLPWFFGTISSGPVRNP